jgi:hypothetical protein
VKSSSTTGKRNLVTISALLLAIWLPAVTFAMGCQDTPMMAEMDDPDSRSMMMDQIADNPEMRHEMMQKMMQSMNMDMYQMMNDPEMRARMEKHAQMMQSMTASDEMDQTEMSEMMDDPEMKEMMQMHMMGLQMMNGGMMGKHSSEDSEEHAH